MRRANAVRRTVVDYGPDPADDRTLGLIASTWAWVQGVGKRAIIGADDDDSRTFTGYGPEIQRFSLAASIGGGLPYRSGAYPTIETGIVVSETDPAMRIFADRLARRQG